MSIKIISRGINLFNKMSCDHDINYNLQLVAYQRNLICILLMEKLNKHIKFDILNLNYSNQKDQAISMEKK